MSEDTQTMIQHALDQDWNKANKIFGDMMSAKVQDVLDQEKIRLAIRSIMVQKKKLKMKLKR